MRRLRFVALALMSLSGCAADAIGEEVAAAEAALHTPFPELDTFHWTSYAAFTKPVSFGSASFSTSAASLATSRRTSLAPGRQHAARTADRPAEVVVADRQK